MTRSSAGKLYHPINRRSFLHVAAGALAAPLVATRASAGTPVIENTIPQCPVGFVDRHDIVAAAAEDGLPLQQRVIPAEQLRSGDRRLASKGVRLQFGGIRLPEGHLADRLKEVKLDLSMEVPNCETASVPWHMWSYSNSGVLSVSGGVDAFVPLRNDGSLVFDMTVQWDNAPAQTYQAKLTAGREGGVPKLRAGTYCMAIPDGRHQHASTWKSARWQDAGSMACAGLYLPAKPEAHPITGEPVSFAHLVFTIDEGSSESLVNA